MIGDKAIAAWEQFDAGQGGPLDNQLSMVAKWERELAEWEELASQSGQEEKMMIQHIINDLQGLISDLKRI